MKYSEHEELEFPQFTAHSTEDGQPVLLAEVICPERCHSRYAVVCEDGLYVMESNQDGAEHGTWIVTNYDAGKAILDAITEEALFWFVLEQV